MSYAPAKILAADMPSLMQMDAIACARTALKTCLLEKEVAACIRKRFDCRHPGGYWQCIVGRKFGTSTMHKDRHFIHFSFETASIVLFQSP